jgi:hypothetical protein
MRKSLAPLVTTKRNIRATIMHIIETIIFTIAATLFVPIMAFATLCLFFKTF